MSNIGWKFYKGLYLNLNQNNFINTQTLESIANTVFRKSNAFIDDYLAPYGFELKVEYPGLLIGSGYFHGIPNDDNDIKIGFYFDFISGYPVIPSSSVKGVLRSFFEGEFLDEKQELINSILNKKVDIEKLKNEIFEGVDENNAPINIYKRDKFFDSYVVSVDDGLFAFDYITAHKEFQEPNPVRFLKVRPGVKFRFNFLLNDGLISAKEKEKLFFELIKIHGVGAKTNSGYGSFEESSALVFSHKERIIEREKIEQKRLKKLQEEKQKEILKSLPPHQRVFEEYKNNLTELINKIEEISKEENADVVELAKLIKAELQKSPKTWEKAKKKALKRKEKIQKILGEI